MAYVLGLCLKLLTLLPPERKVFCFRGYRVAGVLPPLFFPATDEPSLKDVLSYRGKTYYLIAVRRMDLSPMRLFAENAAAFFKNIGMFYLKHRGVWEDGRRSVKR